MDNVIIRQILGVIAGVLVGGIVVFIVEYVGHSVFPPPAGMDLANPEHVARLIDSLPVGALAMVVVGWFAGCLAGALVANRIARNTLAGWIVAVLFILLTAYNFTIIPHPVWMMAAGVGLPLVAAWIAARPRWSAGRT